MLLSLAYIAGVFDSDGSFSIVRHTREGSTKGFSYRVLLQITWRDIPETVGVLEELQWMYGGSVIRGIEKSGLSKHTHYVRFRIDAKQARRLIKGILPYLRIKKRQAEICLRAALIISRTNHGRWNPRPPEEWDELERLCRENAILNWSKGKGRRKKREGIIN